MSAFAISYRLRSTRSVSSNTSRLTKTGSPLAIRDQSSAAPSILRLIVAGQIPDQDIGINTEHQRDRSAMGTGFLPFLYNSPASSETCLFFTHMTTTPSGINVKLILSPVLVRNRFWASR